MVHPHYFVVVSDDRSVVQKAQQFGQMNGFTVQVMSQEQWEQLNQRSRSPVPALAAGSQMSEGGKVLPFPGGGGFSSGPTSSNGDPRRTVATINQLESLAIENAIAAFKGNLTEAAKALGIGRATLYRKVKQYNLDPSTARKKKVA